MDAESALVGHRGVENHGGICKIGCSSVQNAKKTKSIRVEQGELAQKQAALAGHGGVRWRGTAACGLSHFRSGLFPSKFIFIKYRTVAVHSG